MDKGTIASRTVTIESVKLHYLTAGHGPTLILLHGYTQTSRMWKPIIPPLAEKFTVIAPDLPGIGDSIRRRDGATRWGLFRDPAEPGRFVESFLVESWAEHLRQHARGTASDREIVQCILGFHIGPGQPAVTHLIAERVPG